MVYKQAGEHKWYYECPNCHYTIGKPSEVKDAVSNETDNS